MLRAHNVADGHDRVGRLADRAGERRAAGVDHLLDERVVRRVVAHLRRTGIAAEARADERRVGVLVAEPESVPELVRDRVLRAAATDHDVDAPVLRALAAGRLGVADAGAADARLHVHEPVARHEIGHAVDALLGQDLVVLRRARRARVAGEHDRRLDRACVGDAGPARLHGALEGVDHLLQAGRLGAHHRGAVDAERDAVVEEVVGRVQVARQVHHLVLGVLELPGLHVGAERDVGRHLDRPHGEVRVGDVLLVGDLEVDPHGRPEPAPAALAQEELVAAAPEGLDLSLDAGLEGDALRVALVLRPAELGEPRAALRLGHRVRAVELVLQPGPGDAGTRDAVGELDATAHDDDQLARRRVVLGVEAAGRVVEPGAGGAGGEVGPAADAVRRPGVRLRELRGRRELLAREHPRAREHARERGVTRPERHAGDEARRHHLSEGGVADPRVERRGGGRGRLRLLDGRRRLGLACRGGLRRHATDAVRADRGAPERTGVRSGNRRMARPRP